MFDVKKHLIKLKRWDSTTKKMKEIDYLPIFARIEWFRNDHPDYLIDTVLVDHNKEAYWVLFMAKVFDNKNNQLSSGYGSESIKDFRDYIEKAETKAIGRALAILGYGTQFAIELDEGERYVDSPVAKRDVKQI